MIDYGGLIKKVNGLIRHEIMNTAQQDWCDYGDSFFLFLSKHGDVCSTFIKKER